MSNNDARSMKDLVSILIKQLGLNEQILEQKIKADWQEIVGDIASLKIQVLSLKDGVLYLNSSASVWTNEFGLRKSEIINKINIKYNCEIIRNITIN